MKIRWSIRQTVFWTCSLGQTNTYRLSMLQWLHQVWKRCLSPLLIHILRGRCPGTDCPNTDCRHELRLLSTTRGCLASLSDQLTGRWDASWCLLDSCSLRDVTRSRPIAQTGLQVGEENVRWIRGGTGTGTGNELGHWSRHRWVCFDWSLMCFGLVANSGGCDLAGLSWHLF